MTEYLEGKTWVILGALRNTNHSKFSERLSSYGAKVVRDVSDDVDYAVKASHDPPELLSQKELMTRQLGIPIFEQAQLEAILRGEVEAAIPSVEVKAMRKSELLSSRKVLTTLRSVLFEPPTPATWKKIIALLDRCREEDLPVVVDYLLPYTMRWPVPHPFAPRETIFLDDLIALALPRSWRSAVSLGQDSAKFRVVRDIDLRGARMSGRSGLAFLECVHFDGAHHLDLRKNDLSAAFYTALNRAEHLSGLTHLSLGEGMMSQRASEAFTGDSTLGGLIGLRLDALEITGGLAGLLSAGCFARLEHLEVARMPDSAVIGRALGAATGLSALERLEIQAEGALDADLAQLFEAPHLASLRHLDLKSAPAFGEQCFARLSEATHLTGLNSLELPGVATEASLREATHLLKLERFGGDVSVAVALAESDVFRPRGLRLSGFLAIEHIEALLQHAALDAIEELRFSHTLDERSMELLLSSPALMKLRSISSPTMLTDGILFALARNTHLGALEWLGLRYVPAGVTRGAAEAAIAARHVSEGVRKQIRSNLRRVLER